MENTDWIEYKPGKKTRGTHKISKIILHEIEGTLIHFFGYQTKIRPERTRLIKDKLALLGHDKFGYKVYANGLSPHLRQLNGGTFKNTEWLYDLHWYVEGKSPYTTIRLPLIMECEWQQKRRGDSKVPFSGIKYDFQKLLTSNAELRLMIFKIISLNDFDALSSYFEDNIQNYEHLMKGSRFLFIAFHDRQKTFYYREITKS